jgi:hypothetical protein
MSWNQFKDGEKRSDIGLNTQKVKTADEKPNIASERAQKATRDGESKADEQLTTLNNTLKNMIHSSNKVDAPVEASLTGFYKEISKAIVRK